MAGEKIIHGHEVREHTVHSYRSRHGRSNIIIVCPWCGIEEVAYVWSLAGSGKRCSMCKDVIHYTCNSAKRLPEEDNATTKS